jgi:secreted PhoX family phosphatase
MELTGPAAGHNLLKTSADFTGTEVIDMLNQCSAGIRPWCTVLSTEETFHQYFAKCGQLPEGVDFIFCASGCQSRYVA